MRWIHLCGAACIASLLPSGAVAAVIFDQSIDLTSGAITSEIRFPFTHQIADDFQLRSGANPITDVHWWGLYGTSNTPGNDSFVISIFADISGTPEDFPLHEFRGVGAFRVDTGVDLIIPGEFAYDVFAYSTGIAPLPLAANTTYWLSIQNTSAEFTDWRWNVGRSDVGNASADRRNEEDAWSVFRSDSGFGFQLTNDAVAVPEPATWALFAAGLAGLSLMNRRRKVA